MSLLHGELYLAAHEAIQLTVISGHPARIDNDKRPGRRTLAHAGESVHAVSCQTGKVGNQGIPGSGQSIEQGRFPDVGTSDHGDYR